MAEMDEAVRVFLDSRLTIDEKLERLEAMAKGDDQDLATQARGYLEAPAMQRSITGARGRDAG